MGEGSKGWCSEIPFTSSTKIVDHVNGVNDETRKALQLYLPLAGDECKCPRGGGGGGGGGVRMPKDCTRKSHFPKDGAQKSHSRPLQRLWNHIAGVNDEIRSALHLYLSLFGDECEWVGGAIGLYAQIPHTSFTESAESDPHRYDDAELQNTYIKSL